LSIGSPTAHDVIAFIEFCDEPRNICRIVLEVAIHRNDNVSTGKFKSRRHGSGLAEVSPEFYNVHIFFLRMNLSQ
jgi:hypothetical protein